jgi:hypothetical protein
MIKEIPEKYYDFLARFLDQIDLKELAMNISVD